MKKAMTLSLALLLTASLTACTPGAGVKSGTAASEELLKLLPKGTVGVMVFDVQRAMATPAAAKALQDPKAKEKYDEFVKMTGIDPMKDIRAVAVGFGGLTGASAAGVVLDLTYDQTRLQGLIKEKAPDAKEETYNGVTIYTTAVQASRGLLDNGALAAFLDPSHIILGNEKGVKGIIDVHQKRGESVAKDAAMAGILKKADKSATGWGAFAIPQDLLKKSLEASPQLKAFANITAITMAFDNKMGDSITDIRAHGGNKEQNAELASALSGFKAMGAMFAAQEPTLGELLNAIQITSGEDFTRLSITIPQELMDKLSKMAQSKSEELIKKDQPAEVKK